MSFHLVASISDLLRDLEVDFRDALRGLRGSRGTTLLAFGVLTITMAAGTVTYSVVDGVALRPLPYGSPERLVGLSTPGPAAGKTFPASPRDYFDWLQGTRTFESLGAARFTSVQVEFAGGIETLPARRVTTNLFEVLGVRPAAGRFFSHEHERPGGPEAIVLSHALWVSKFGSDPRVIGRGLKVDQDVREVVGVLPAGVTYPITLGGPAGLYLPYVVTNAERMNDRCCIFVVGRLAPRVSVEQARADVQRFSSAVVLPLHDEVVGPAKKWMLLVLAAVGFVLLVAFVNVASLVLARATTRARALAIREALGASRTRLARVLLLEGLVLSLASAVAASLFSFWGVEIAKSIVPPGVTRVSEIAVDGRVLLASLAAGLLCGVVISSAPAWLSARSDLLSFQQAGGNAVIGSRRHSRLLSGFLVADVAFVSLLLIAATLVVSSYVKITTADLGFDRRNVMFLWYHQSLKDVIRANRPAVVATLRAKLLERAKSVPGVTDAALLTTGPPLSGTGVTSRIVIPGIEDGPGNGTLETREVTKDYFRVMGMQLIRGRPFDSTDHLGAAHVMLINDVAARLFFPDRDPIGHVLNFQGPTTVIGVLKGVRAEGPESEVRPEGYTPLEQKPYRDLDVPSLGGPVTVGGLVVRTNRDARGLSAAVAEAVRPVVSSLPNPTSFVDDDFRRLTAARRFNAALMGTFGLIAVVIGGIGVYGTMAFFVVQQVRAIGLHMTLGASPGHVLRSVLQNALRRVGIGIVIGLTGAWLVSSAFASFVFGIRPTAPVAYVAVAGFLSLTAVAAAFVPALRAARLDPLVALRHE